MQTERLLREAVLPRVATLAASSGPGEVGVGTYNLSLAAAGSAGLRRLAEQLADVVGRLSLAATEPGAHAAAATGVMRETLAEKALEPGEHWALHDVEIPSGIDFVGFVRTVTTGLDVRWIGGNQHTIFGAGLDTTENLIQQKANKLQAWADRYAERWLLVAVAGYSRTSVQQVRFDAQRFGGTGFDRITSSTRFTRSKTRTSQTSP